MEDEVGYCDAKLQAVPSALFNLQPARSYRGMLLSSCFDMRPWGESIRRVWVESDHLILCQGTSWIIQIHELARMLTGANGPKTAVLRLLMTAFMFKCFSYFVKH